MLITCTRYRSALLDEALSGKFHPLTASVCIQLANSCRFSSGHWLYVLILLDSFNSACEAGIEISVGHLYFSCLSVCIGLANRSRFSWSCASGLLITMLTVASCQLGFKLL